MIIYLDEVSMPILSTEHVHQDQSIPCVPVFDAYLCTHTASTLRTASGFISSMAGTYPTADVPSNKHLYL